jgi:predicted ATPase
MLKSIEVSNFKAFASAKLDLKPITILLGSNSSGKSSLLQLMLLLAQSGAGSGPVLRTNGAYVSAGSPLNLMHKRDAHSEIEFSLNIEPVEIMSLERLRVLCYEMLTVFVDYLKTKFPGETKVRASPKYVKAIEHISSLQEKGKVIADSELMEVLPSFVTVAKEAKKIIRSASRTGKTVGSSAVDVRLPKAVSDQSSKSQREALEQLIDVLEATASAMRWPGISKVSYRFGYIKSSAQLEVLSVDLIAGKKSMLQFARRDAKRRLNCDLSSDYFDERLLRKYKRRLKDILYFDGISVKVADRPRIPGRPDAFASICGGILVRATNAAAVSFNGSNIKHVSPLRAFPKRYYYSDQLSSDALDTKDGDSLADILKRRTGVRDQVNRWLTRFGMTVKVQDIRDLIQSIRVRQNGMDMDLTDVGFGISQVLPVIVQGFLGGKNTLSLIEQPEIHLHPRMQADLADLFIDMVKANSGRLVIETHSEYLLKRLRRRIAEGKISSEDVAIHLVHGSIAPKGRASTVEIVQIGQRGAFKWPSDFEVDLQDTIEFAKLQAGVDEVRPAPDRQDS